MFRRRIFFVLALLIVPLFAGAQERPGERNSDPSDSSLTNSPSNDSTNSPSNNLTSTPDSSPTDSLRLSRWALKTNLLYLATASPNIAAETRLGDGHWTGQLSLGYNPFPMGKGGTRKWKHVAVMPEARYWFDQPFYKHFLAAHLFYSHYNAGNVHLPFGIFPELRDNRLQGDVGAVGLGYGYSWRLKPRFSLEFEVGAGVFLTGYKMYECRHCGSLIEKNTKVFVGPTKLAINAVVHLGRTVREPLPEAELPEPLLAKEEPQTEEPPVPTEEPAVQPQEPTVAERMQALEREFPILRHISQYSANREGTVYVHFPLDSTALRRDFRDNAATLDLIIDATRRVTADAEARLRLIQIIGLASVEGPVKHNEELGRQRAEALKRYVQDALLLPDSAFECINGGEGWTELREAVAALQTEWRDDVLRIIDNEPDPDRREQRIRRLRNGLPYRYLRDNVLRDQRNSSYIRVYYDY